jgi:hypothetical protein
MTRLRHARRPDRYLLEDNAQRLAAIRSERDPDGVFAR